MTTEHALALIDILEKDGHATRFVGGCVRDELLGEPVTDIDLATTATPEEMLAAFSQAGIKTVPTGLAHGTLTAVIEGKGYEITSLRKDVATDGRHATVAFTKDWAEDAKRRDFTINALFRDKDGKIHDFVGGVADIEARRVRFVGSAEARIAEDYLRILRFFRFHAWIAKDMPDGDTLKALREAAAHLKELSRERVWKELAKLLAAPDPSETLMLMLRENVMANVLPEADQLATLCSLISYERMRKKQQPFNPLLRLTALLKERNVTAEDLQIRFALSSEETKKLALYLANPLVFKGGFDAAQLSFGLHRYGFDLTEDFMILAQAKGAAFSWESAVSVLEKWVPKSFPLKGEDLLALGLQPGPKMGKILRSVEDWWMAQNFAPDHAACLSQAKKLIEEDR